VSNRDTEYSDSKQDPPPKLNIRFLATVRPGVLQTLRHLKYGYSRLAVPGPETWLSQDEFF